MQVSHHTILKGIISTQSSLNVMIIEYLINITNAMAVKNVSRKRHIDKRTHHCRQVTIQNYKLCNYSDFF